MAISELLIEIGVKVLVGIVLVSFGSLILREIVAKIFKLEDDNISTATSVLFWTALLMFMLSFIPSLPYIGWVLSIFTNIVFVLLVRKYYRTNWKTTAGIWGTWFVVYFVIALFVAATVTLAF